MNSRQKEVELAKLKAEAQELKHLKAIYNKAAADIATKLAVSNGKINVLLADYDNLDDTTRSILQSQIYQRNFQLSLKSQIDGFLRELNNKQYSSIDEYLQDCYETGYIGSMYDLQGQGIPLVTPIDQKKVAAATKLNPKISKNLYTKLGEDVDFLKKRIVNNISRGIATASAYSVIARNIALDSNVGFNRAMRIARTEGHGVQVQATVDAMYTAQDKGANVVKQWDAALDGRTRDSHRMVDGEIRELDEPFSNGMQYPSDPAGGAAEVINCRCALLQRAKWALDEDELQTLKDRAEYFGLDKTKNFEDFKNKYLKAVESSVESGKILTKAVSGARKLSSTETKETVENTAKTAEEMAKKTVEISAVLDYYGTEINVQEVVEKAKAGVRHLGIYKDAMKHTKNQLHKSIESHIVQVQEHKDKTTNPQKYIADWASKTQQQKDGLIRKWKKDMQRNAEQAHIEMAVYEERFGKNE